MGDADEWQSYSSPKEQTGGRDKDGYWWRLPSLGATEGRNEFDRLWTMSEASWKRRGLTGILNESFPFSNSVDNISFGDSDSHEDSHVELKSCSPDTVGSMSPDQSSHPSSFKPSFSYLMKDAVPTENGPSPKNTVGSSGGGIEEDCVVEVNTCVGVKSAGCEAGVVCGSVRIVDVKSTNGEGKQGKAGVAECEAGGVGEGVTVDDEKGEEKGDITECGVGEGVTVVGVKGEGKADVTEREAGGVGEGVMVDDVKGEEKGDITECGVGEGVTVVGVKGEGKADVTECEAGEGVTVDDVKGEEKGDITECGVGEGMTVVGVKGEGKADVTECGVGEGVTLVGVKGEGKADVAECEAGGVGEGVMADDEKGEGKAGVTECGVGEGVTVVGVKGEGKAGVTECEAGGVGEDVKGEGKAGVSECEAGGVVGGVDANGQGEGTEEMELEVALKADIVGSEPTGSGKDVLPELQPLPGTSRRDVSGIRPQSARDVKENVPPTTTAQHRASNMYKKSKLPTKITTTAAGPASLRLSRGSTSLLPSRGSTEYLGKDRKKKDNLDTTGASSIISKSTLSHVNPARQFGGSRLVKPASRLPLGSTHSSKLFGPGQPGISVDALKRINTIKLGSANPLPRASQPMACTSRQRGTQPRSRSKTITKAKNGLPSIASFPVDSEVSQPHRVPPRNRQIPIFKGLCGKPQSAVENPVPLPGTLVPTTADVSAAVTSSAPPLSNLLPVSVATTCSKASHAQPGVEASLIDLASPPPSAVAVNEVVCTSKPNKRRSCIPTPVGKTRVCKTDKLKVALRPVKKQISSSVVVSGQDLLLGMSSKVADDRDNFPDNTLLPGMPLQECSSSSTSSLGVAMPLSSRDGIGDDGIINRAALKIVNCGNQSKSRQALGKNHPEKVPSLTKPQVMHSPINKENLLATPHSKWSPVKRKTVVGAACFNCTKKTFRYNKNENW